MAMTAVTGRSLRPLRCFSILVAQPDHLGKSQKKHTHACLLDPEIFFFNVIVLG